MMADGVNPASLAALATCATPSPPPAVPPPVTSPPPVASPPPPACPVATRQSFAAAVSPCATTANACSTCKVALAMPFILQGVASTDTASLGACISAQAAFMTADGVNPASLAALATCATPSPPPPPPPLPSPLPPPTCSITTPQDFSAAVSKCSNPALACTTCVVALATPFVMAGVPSDDTLQLGACISAQAGSILAAGVPITSLTALGNCPKPPPPPAPSQPPAPASCPVTAAQNFSAAVAPCSDATTACSSGCSQALATPFVMAGVSAADVATLGACISAQSSLAIAAGVNVASLAALGSCPKPPPPPSPAAAGLVLSPTLPPSACPVRAMLDFTAAVAPCSSPAGDVCGACLSALAAPVIISGASRAARLQLAAKARRRNFPVRGGRACHALRRTR